MRGLFLLVLLLVACTEALSFGYSVPRTLSLLSPKVRVAALQANALSPFEDDDSSEGQVMSSSGLAELKRLEQKAKEDAERKEREEAAAKLAAELEEKRLQESKKAVVPVVAAESVLKVNTEVEKAKKVDTGGLSTAGGAAGEVFDFGLLIAFPIIISTLALFFLFPIIGKDLVKDLPPVPTTF